MTNTSKNGLFLIIYTCRKLAYKYMKLDKINFMKISQPLERLKF